MALTIKKLQVKSAEAYLNGFPKEMMLFQVCSEGKIE